MAGCHLRIHVHYGSHGHNQLIFIHMFLRCSWSSLAPTPGRSARGLSLNLKGVPRRGSGACEMNWAVGLTTLTAQRPQLPTSLAIRSEHLVYHRLAVIADSSMPGSYCSLPTRSGPEACPTSSVSVVKCNQTCSNLDILALTTSSSTTPCLKAPLLGGF